MKANEILVGISDADSTNAVVTELTTESKQTAEKAAPKTAKKTTQKAEQKPKATVKKATKEASLEKKPEVKEETAKKAKVVTKKSAVKKTAEKKTGTKKATLENKVVNTQDIKREVYFQYTGKQIDEETLVKKVLADCKSQNIAVGTLKIYLKPEDNACYYVVNGTVAGSVELY